MKVRQQHDSERRYSPLEEKEEPDKEEDDDSKNPHTHSNNPPVAAVTPGPARLHMISRENEDPQINYNYKDTRDRRGWKHRRKISNCSPLQSSSPANPQSSSLAILRKRFIKMLRPSSGTAILWHWRFSFLSRPTQAPPCAAGDFFTGTCTAPQAIFFRRRRSCALLLLLLLLALAAGCWPLPPLPLGLRVSAPKLPPSAGRR